MTHPIISATITNYNYGRFIGKAIESVLKQTFTSFELIIVDNASTDNSLSVIKQYMEQDSRIILIEHKENKGHIYSLREACDLTQGRYRVHIDADDWIIDPCAFELQLSLLEREPDITFVFSAFTLFEGDHKCVLVSSAYDQDTIQSGENAIEKVLNLSVAHSGPMIRMETYRVTGGYDNGFIHANDLKLWHDLCIQGNVGYIDRPLYATRQHDLSLSKSATIQVLQKDALRIVDLVFSGPLAKNMHNPGSVKRRVIRKLLTHYSTQLAFSGQYLAAWQAYWVNLKLRPIDTLLQRQTFVLTVRTLLGANGYSTLARLRASISHKKRRNSPQIHTLDRNLED